jgi:hypothetical protein
VDDLVYETVTFKEAFSTLAKTEGKILAVFDFDDTLVKSNSKVIIHRGSKTLHLTPAEYAVYEKKEGDDIDFSEFDKIIEPEIIKENFQLFKEYIQNPKHDTVILTARGEESQDDLKEYLESVGVDTGKVEVVTVGSSDPMKKAMWIFNKAKNSDYDTVEFFDDSLKNVKAVKSVDTKLDTVVNSHHVVHAA